MYDFKGRYNYLVPFVRFVMVILMGIGWAALFSFFRHEVNARHFYAFEWFMVILALGVILPLGIYWYAASLFRQYNSIKIVGGKIILKHAFLFWKTRLPLDRIKGFSTTELYNKWVTFSSINLYLENGKVIEFPQFVFLNYKFLKPGLENAGVKYLGHEDDEHTFRRKYKYRS